MKIGPGLFTAVAILNSHMLARVFYITVEFFVDAIDDRLMQRFLVSLQRQYLVGIPLDDLRRNRLLSPHRIDGDD